MTRERGVERSGPLHRFSNDMHMGASIMYAIGDGMYDSSMMCRDSPRQATATSSTTYYVFIPRCKRPRRAARRSPAPPPWLHMGGVSAAAGHSKTVRSTPQGATMARRPAHSPFPFRFLMSSPLPSPPLHRSHRRRSRRCRRGSGSAPDRPSSSHARRPGPTSSPAGAGSPQ